MLAPTQKGLIAEGRFIQWAYKYGYKSLCKPLEHDQSFDFLVYCEIQQAWIKVQVKSTYTGKRPSMREVNFRRGRTKNRTAYKATDFDWMFVYDDPSGRIWWIPWPVVAKVKSCFIVSGKRFNDYEVTE